MKTFGLIFFGFFLGFLFGFMIVFIEMDHDIFHRVGCWLDNLKKSRSGVVYIVRKSHTNLYLKEDYSFSTLGEGLAPLLFSSMTEARMTMEILEWENSSWVIIETEKDILSNVITWSRSEKEKPKKENFHKFKIDDRLSINENRESNDIEPITRRCANCDQSELGDSLWYCFETGRFMSPNGWCESWGGREKDA